MAGGSVNREELLKALEDRREILLKGLQQIGTEKMREYETAMLEGLNTITHESHTMEQYQTERRTEIKAMLTENICTYNFIDRGSWEDPR
jgi:hypothetical protein